MGTMKKAAFTLSGDRPVELVDTGEVVTPNDDDARRCDQVSKTVKSYLTAAEQLVNGKYAHLREITPAHLANPGNVLVVCGSEGVVIRYEPKVENATRRFAVVLMEGS